jgi:hypothetical protein
MRLYHYYFEDMEKPITVQAANKELGRDMMLEKLQTLPDYYNKKVVQETTSMPLEGITTVEINGVMMVWSKQGWIEKQ